MSDQSDQPGKSGKRWQGWARTPGTPYTKIEGALAEKRGDCYALCMELVALKPGADLDHEFLILPEGEFPAVQTTYHDRMMRPRR